MPTFTVERQYLVPVYDHLTLDAVDVAAACQLALDEDVHPWGDNPAADYETSRETQISGVWTGGTAHVGACLEIPAEHDVTY